MSNFRYSRLMEIKEKFLEQKQRDLEATLTTIEAVTAELSKVEEEVTMTYSEMTARCFYGKELSSMIDHVALLDRRKGLLLQERATEESKADSLRKDLMDIEIDLKMLEKLKTNIVKAESKTQSKKDQKLMDELALRMDGR
jgi:flagellar export protein FliJ